MTNCFCQFDDDGRCKECLKTIAECVSNFVAIMKRATEEMAEVNERFDIGCEFCLRTNFDLAVSQFVKGSFSSLPHHTANGVRVSFKAMLESRGIETHPLTDKALGEIEEKCGEEDRHEAAKHPPGRTPRYGFGTRLRWNDFVGYVDAAFANYNAAVMCRLVPLDWFEAQKVPPSTKDQIFYSIFSAKGAILAGENDVEQVNDHGEYPA